MMKPQFFHKLPEMEKGYSMSLAVRAGDYVFIGGLTATDNKGNELHADNPGAQMKRIYEILDEVLKEFGGTSRDVVSEVIYYDVSGNEYTEKLFPHRRAFYGEEGPSVVGMQVVGFISPAIHVETTAVAFLPQPTLP
ncbi:Rid family hydrolase [Phyllobacterium sp. 22229]|uniref:Rid family hydrolase n=1 Tax=Agrobacterium radiobacter TaxID=362 RepID=A0ABD5LQ12_AGRRD